MCVRFNSIVHEPVALRRLALEVAPCTTASPDAATPAPPIRRQQHPRRAQRAAPVTCPAPPLAPPPRAAALTAPPC
ncbi:unnamed protein product [Plutella xylostella]|uniref:(diamondback moth) hypothetical protein n=1 Tax=Plutella xylostella TaxID=51655 RepID=A0A8S4FGR4_PLUXY|nr:unnamed protein product [Plutella xylostella]